MRYLNGRQGAWQLHSLVRVDKGQTQHL